MTKVTDTVNVPRGALEKAVAVIQHLDPSLQDVGEASFRALVGSLAAAPKAECELETQEREEKALRDQMFARVDRLFDVTQPEAPKVEQDYAELKRLAEGASQGPWKACGTIYEHMNCEIRTGAKGEGQPIGQIWDGPNAFADGQFIAAASPEVVLGLLARASSPAPASDELLEAADFLADRVADHEHSLEADDFYGHVLPALARYRLAKHKGPQS